MNTTYPTIASPQEIQEISQIVELQDQCGCSDESELLEELDGRYIAKFEKYVTDGPGYAGELFLIVWGIPTVTMIVRNPRTRALEVQPDCA